MATQKQVSSWIVGAGIGDQQVGTAWIAADQLVSLSVNGDLNIFDKRGSTDGPVQMIRVCLHLQTTHSHCSHTVPLQLYSSGPDSNLSPTGSDEIGHRIYSHPLSVSTFYVGSYEGRIIYTSIEAGMENVKGDGHTSLVPCLMAANGGRAWSTSVGFDDKIREITANKFAWVHRLSVDIWSIFGSNMSLEQADLLVNQQPTQRGSIN